MRFTSPSPRRLLQSASPCSLVTMCDQKATIKNADMLEEMQQDLVECATQALEKYNIEKDIAQA